MKNATTSLLDQVKARHGLTSDYQLSKLLEIRDSAIGNYRAGRSQMSDDIAVKVAELLELAPGAVLAELAAERAKSPATVRAWRDAARQLGKAAAIVVVGIGVGGLAGVALMGEPATVIHAVEAGDPLRIMSNGKHVLAALFGAVALIGVVMLFTRSR